MSIELKEHVDRLTRQAIDKEDDLLREAFDHVWGKDNWSLPFVVRKVSITKYPDRVVYKLGNWAIVTIYSAKVEQDGNEFKVSFDFDRDYLASFPRKEATNEQ